MRTAWNRPLAPVSSLSLALLFSLVLGGCSLFGSDDEGDGTPPPAGLQAGVYELRDTVEMTEEDFGVEGTAYLHGFLQLRADSTYLLQAYITSDDLEVEEILFQEERGRFRLADSVIFKTEVETRTSFPGGHGLAYWENQEDYETLSRAFSSAGFQTYEEEDGAWNSWKRVSGAADLSTDERVAYLDAVTAYSLRLSAAWDSEAETTISGTRYDLRTVGDVADGFAPNFLVRTIAKNPGQSLEARMNAEGDALEAIEGVTVTSRSLVPRGGVSTAVIVINNASGANTFKQKLVFFERGELLVMQIYTDLASRYDQNTEFQSIEASLKFY